MDSPTTFFKGVDLRRLRRRRLRRRWLGWTPAATCGKHPIVYISRETPKLTFVLSLKTVAVRLVSGLPNGNPLDRLERNRLSNIMVMYGIANPRMMVQLRPWPTDLFGMLYIAGLYRLPSVKRRQLPEDPQNMTF